MKLIINNYKYFNLKHLGNFILKMSSKSNKNLCFTKYDQDRLKIIGKNLYS